MLTRILCAGVTGLVAACAAAPAHAQSLEVAEKVLDNGMRVLVVHRERVPRVLCSIFVGTGAVQEKTGKTGLAHLLEHMLFKGTHAMGVKDPVKDAAYIAEADRLMTAAYAIERRRRELAQHGRSLSADDEAELQRLRARHTQVAKDQKSVLLSEALWGEYQRNGGTGLNASTGQDSTQFFVELPANKVELFFWLEADRMRDPVFREYYAEIDVVKEERRMRTESTPTGMINEEFQALFWAGHPYGRPVVGWMSDIGVITRQDAADYFWKHYTANNMTAIFVGAVPPERIFALAEQYFSHIRTGPPRQDVVIPGPNPTGAKRLEAEADAPNSISIRWPTVPLRHPDAYALDLLAEVLNGRSGRLRQALVEENKLALGARASARNQRFGGTFSVSARPRPGVKSADVEARLLAEVERLKQAPPDAAEWERVQTAQESSLVDFLGNNRGVMFILGQFAVSGDWHEAQRLFERYRSVKPEDLPRVAKTYLAMDRRAALVIRRKGQGGGTGGGNGDAGADPQAQLVKQLRAALTQLQGAWSRLKPAVRPRALARARQMIARVKDTATRESLLAIVAKLEAEGE